MHSFLRGLAALLLVWAGAAIAGQVPNPLNAPASSTAGHALCFHADNSQQVDDCGTAPGGGGDSLTNGHIFVGNASNVAADVPVSGDASMANTGAVTVNTFNGGTTFGTAATKNTGTTAGTVAAGDDSRITGAAQKSNNLSDLASASTARTNLSLGDAATKNTGTTAGTLAAGDDSRISGAAQKSSSGSDFASVSANTVLAAPNGSSGSPSFRALAGADLPNPSSSTLGGVQSKAAVSHQFLNGISTSGVPSAAQPACGDTSDASAFCNGTDAANLTGVVGASNGGAGTITGALKGNGSGTVSQAAASDLSNGVTGSGNVVLKTSPTLITPALGTPASGDMSNVTNVPAAQLTGTVPAANMNPTVSAHNFLGNNTGSSAAAAFSRPAVADLSDGGTAAQKNTGTSGNTVPLLDGSNTWSSAQTFQKASTNPAGNTGSGTMLPMGVVHTITASAATGTGTSEQTLDTYTLPANSLDVAGRLLRIMGCFKHAANTDSVTSKIYFGATSVSDIGSTTTGNLTCLNMVVLKTGSNTQNVIAGGSKGSITTTLIASTYTAATETDTAGIVIKATGTDGTSAASDDTLVYFAVEFMN